MITENVRRRYMTGCSNGGSIHVFVNVYIANTIECTVSQKERDHVNEAKWKLEDMRAKIHTLRSQKRDLDGRIMEMQSTVSSLREEQKTIESALEEKDNEIKTLRDKNSHIEDENQQVKALSETFRSREPGGIENTKGQLESPANIWSVSTDDLSNASLNSQMEARMNEGKESRGNLNVYTKQEAGEHVTEHVDSRMGGSGNSSSEEIEKQGDLRSEHGGETVQSRKMAEEQSQKQYHSIDSSNPEERINDVEGKISKEETGENKAVLNHDSEVQRSRDETNGGRTLNNKMTETTVDTTLGSNARGAEKQEHGENLRGGMNSKILDNFRIRRHGRRGRNFNLKRANGKRWTIMARSKAGKSEDNGVAESLVNIDSQNKSSRMRNETGLEDPDQKITSLKNSEPSKHDASVDLGLEARNTTSYEQLMVRTNATSTKTEMAHVSLKDAPTDMTLEIDDRKASSEGKQSMHESEQSEKQATGIQHLAEEIDREKEDTNSEQPKTGNLDEERDFVTQDFQEQEPETETSSKSKSNSQANGEDS